MRRPKFGSSLVLVLSLVTGSAYAGTNPGIAPIQSNPHGKSYSEWAAAWWQWALEIPASVNPGLDNTGVNCDQGQSGHVWFLAGTFGGTPVTRTCTVQPGTALFFPLINNGSFAFLTPLSRIERVLNLN